MRRLSICLLLALAALARAENGRIEITQAAIPFVISTSGSYVVTEDLALGGGATPITLIAPGAVWKYLDDGTDQGTAWQATSFDDSTWDSGPAELGYGGDGAVTTNSFGPDPNDKYITTYYRRAFVVTNATAFTDLDLFVNRDDGVVVYLNGTEVARDNMPTGAIDYLTQALAPVDAANEATFFEFDALHTLLVNGTNVIAAEIHQVTNTSTDITFNLELIGDTNVVSSANGITINANHVTIDLAGHVMRGVPDVFGDGIHAEGRHSLLIQNGSLVEWGDEGVDVLLCTNVIVRNIRALRNVDNGIDAGVANVVIDCFASHNGLGQTAFQNDLGNGVRMEVNSLMIGCTLYSNHNHGVDTASACMVLDTMIAHNDHDGLHGGQGNIAGRTMSYRMTDEGLELLNGSIFFDSTAAFCDDGYKARDGTLPEGLCLFHGLTAIQNRNDGIKGEDGSLFVECASSDNGDDNFALETDSLAIGNVSVGGGTQSGATPGSGIFLEGPHNVAIGNHVMAITNNGIGAFNAGSINGLIIGNSASRNGSNFNGTGDDLIAPISTNPATAGPWANFRW